jgi:hypothetical protein
MAQEKTAPFGKKGLTIMAMVAVVAASSSLVFYLYRPYLGRFASTYYVTPFVHIVAAVGAFLFSRRWIGSQMASFFAAMLYAFGPFALSLDPWHPAIPALFALVPWFFCPAAFWARWFHSSEKLPRSLRLAITMTLSLLPLIPIALVFQGLPQLRVFPMPVGARLIVSDLVTLVEPTHISGARFSVGFYHAAIPALALGVAIFIQLKRILPGLMLLAAIVLAFAPPILQISPVIWAVIAMLGFSLIAGLGMEGLTLITAADKKWLILSLAVTAAAMAASLTIGMMQQPQDLFSARLFVMALMPPAFIAVMVWRNMRIRQLRWLFLAVAIGVDIVVSSRQLLDLVF